MTPFRCAKIEPHDTKERCRSNCLLRTVTLSSGCRKSDQQEQQEAPENKTTPVHVFSRVNCFEDGNMEFIVAVYRVRIDVADTASGQWRIGNALSLNLSSVMGLK